MLSFDVTGETTTYKACDINGPDITTSIHLYINIAYVPTIYRRMNTVLLTAAFARPPVVFRDLPHSGTSLLYNIICGNLSP